MPTIAVKRFSRGNFEKAEPPPQAEEIHYTHNEEETENELYEEPYDEPPETDTDDFLADLTRSNYERNIQDEITQKEQLKEQKIKDKETMKIIRQAEKKQGRKRPAATARRGDDDTDSIFSDSPTPVLGRDKRVMLKKVSQYKALFPEHLKKYKIRKNPTMDELQTILDDMQSIIDVSSVDGFITDSILQCFKLVEGVSANTKNFNFTGLSDMLKDNQQFHTLMKQLYIKYQVFQAIPPEYQLCILVATTAYICQQKNKNRDKINSYLDESIPK